MPCCLMHSIQGVWTRSSGRIVPSTSKSAVSASIWQGNPPLGIPSLLFLSHLIHFLTGKPSQGVCPPIYIVSSLFVISSHFYHFSSLSGILQGDSWRPLSWNSAPLCRVTLDYQKGYCISNYSWLKPIEKLTLNRFHTEKLLARGFKQTNKQTKN